MVKNRNLVQITWPCSQKTVELNLLQEFLSSKNIRHILEIGSFKGGTALLWAKMVEPDGMVCCVDLLFSGMIYWNAPWNNWRKYIVEIQGDSHSDNTRKKVESVLGERKIDFLFIDGDHSYEGVRRDFMMYSTFVKTGGFVCLHDILDTPYHRNLPPPDGPVEVCEFWDEIKSTHKSWELCDPLDHTFMGIGVIQL